MIAFLMKSHYVVILQNVHLKRYARLPVGHEPSGTASAVEEISPVRAAAPLRAAFEIVVLFHEYRRREFLIVVLVLNANPSG
jgi:hypothetical protein